MITTQELIDDLNDNIVGIGLMSTSDLMRHVIRVIEDLTTWKNIDTLPEGLKSKPVLVGYTHMGVWVIRSAWWDDGSDWESGGFESRDAAAGWWSVETVAMQDKINPTHWLMATPDV